MTTEALVFITRRSDLGQGPLSKGRVLDGPLTYDLSYPTLVFKTQKWMKVDK